jgi:curved DNA-binding protein CbpA
MELLTFRVAYLAVLLLLSSLAVCRAFHAFGFGGKALSTRTSSSSSSAPSFLSCTTAKSTDEIISPVVYENDLYGVLGLEMNCTKRDIKEAYWRIAAPNHPDRNNTDEALYIFRNASYAYSILGKSPKTRSQYDAKLKSKIYGRRIGEIGNDVILPFAKDVALPLLNFTINSIGTFAKPLLRNAYESTTAVLDAVNSEDETELALDVFTRAGMAYERTSFDQKIRGLKEQIERTSSQLESTKKDLEKAKVQEKVEEEKLETLMESQQSPVNDDFLQDLEEGWAAETGKEYESIGSTVSTVPADNLINDLESAYKNKSDKLAEAMEEVNALQSKLLVAFQRVEAIQSELSTLQGQLEAEKKNHPEMSDGFRPPALNGEYQQPLAIRDINSELDSVAQPDTEEKDEIGMLNESLSRQREYRLLLDRKAKQLAAKKTALESELKITNETWAYKEETRAREEKERLRMQERSEAALSEDADGLESKGRRSSSREEWESVDIGDAKNSTRAFRGFG